ncbi:acyltransferase 3 [Penicillium macrosclerotiorum]|uniref:acyltransferase 3 n=1 Tax=Penicillium macrosclerotiorum TaxID=303699 RepID=UPI0025485AE2|nr:acyltransferase 3 [Penicillium macrosclerotiorum]KAJ5698887.1 acyltransferase 3 [Penicillium macrosclerotiorum]
MDRTTWLDGLRGIAAAIVATDHYFMGGVLDNAFLSFWADPPEENRRLIQLPPIRLLFAAHAMVPLFLVISGYAISINLLRLRQSNDGEFVRRLASAVTRRVFRIYLPVFVITVISQVLFFCNLYQWNFGDDALWGRRPWTTPWRHVTFVFRYMIDNLNIISFQGNPGLNGQLWTMPLEFRGSCITYLTILGLAFWRPQLRRLALACLTVYWFYFGLWDIFGFMAGLYMAEMRILSGATSIDEEPKLPFHTLTTIWASKMKSPRVVTLRNAICFIFGTYLVCLSDDGHLPPGYQFLEAVESSRWDGDWAVMSKCWKTVGSVLVVFAISQSPSLQRPLNVRPIQYLGKISFSLYLVHQSVYHLVRDPIRNFLWFVATRDGYPGTQAASEYTGPFAFSWLTGFVILSVINLYVAGLYTRFVDERCVDVARKIDRWLTH